MQASSGEASAEAVEAEPSKKKAYVPRYGSKSALVKESAAGNTNDTLGGKDSSGKRRGVRFDGGGGDGGLKTAAELAKMQLERKQFSFDQIDHG